MIQESWLKACLSSWTTTSFQSLRCTTTFPEIEYREEDIEAREETIEDSYNVIPEAGLIDSFSLSQTAFEQGQKKCSTSRKRKMWSLKLVVKRAKDNSWDICRQAIIEADDDDEFIEN